MNNDVYVLQKDLPYAKAGAEYHVDDNGNYRTTDVIQNGNVTYDILNKAVVENNPDWFKKKEQPKDWQVQSFLTKDLPTNTLLTRMPDGLYGQFFAVEEELLKSPLHFIYSVKRLSDGKVFTIGDEVNCDKCPKSFSKQKIEKFIVSETGVMVASCAGVDTSINNMSHLTEQPAQDFVWTDELVKDAILEAWLTGTFKSGLSPAELIKKIKTSKGKQNDIYPEKCESCADLTVCKTIGRCVRWKPQTTDMEAILKEQIFKLKLQLDACKTEKGFWTDELVERYARIRAIEYPMELRHVKTTISEFKADVQAEKEKSKQKLFS